MLNNLNLAELLTFPIKDAEARKNFLIITLVYFLSFIVPILPLLAAIGYTARIMREIVAGCSARMPAWDDWESMFKDGLILFGVRLVYAIPILVVFVPLFLGMAFLPFWFESSGGSDGQFAVIFLLFGLAMLFIFPLSLALGIIVPAAEVHTAIQNDFTAGFRFREWWPIFRANWVGFLLAYLIAMVGSMVLSTIVSIAMMTIILFCVVPFIMPAITAYLTLVMYAAFAQAYKDGKALA